MDFKKLWFWLSAGLAAGVPLYLFFNIGLEFLGFDGFLGLDFYHFIILGIILFPFLLKYLVKVANKKNFPNYFLWFVIFSVMAISILSFLLWISLGRQDDGLIFLFIGPQGIIFLIISIIIFFKSKKLS